jgi:hypothetical protein
MTYTLNDSNLVATELFCAFYTQIEVDFIDREPCKANVSDAGRAILGGTIPLYPIKGFIDGVPKLGSPFYLAFVGESVDCRWFGSEEEIDNWGDSGVYSASWTHTYTAPGFYWARKGDSTGALAARQVRVIYRNPPPTYTPFDISYPVAIDSSSEGGIDTPAALQFTIRVNGRFDQAKIVNLKDRTGVGIFGQEYRDGIPYGNIRLIAGGWISDPGATLKISGNDFTFTSYSMTSWINLAYMREQDYVSPELQAMIMGADAAAAGTLNTDYLGLGYNPNHWIQADAVTVACHVLQHIWIQFFDDPNPNMYYPQDINGYGMISQFLDVITDSDYTEANGLPGNKLQGFTVNEGNVLSNLRSNLLDNEGWQLFDRFDLRMKLGRKPYFRVSQPAPVLVLDDLYKAGNGLEIHSGDQIKVRQVIVERPADSSLLPPIDTTPVGGFSPTAPYDPAAPYDTYNSANCTSGGNPASGPGISGTVTGWNTNNTGLMNQAANFVNGSVDPNGPTNPFNEFDPNKFLYKWPIPERDAGETITVNGIYSVDLETWAKGFDKQRRSRWQLTVNLLNYLDVDIGDQVTVTYSSGKPWNLIWVDKNFYVISVQLMIDMLSQTTQRQITLMEIDPDE